MRIARLHPDVRVDVRGNEGHASVAESGVDSARVGRLGPIGVARLELVGNVLEEIAGDVTFFIGPLELVVYAKRRTPPPVRIVPERCEFPPALVLASRVALGEDNRIRRSVRKSPAQRGRSLQAKLSVGRVRLSEDQVVRPRSSSRPTHRRPLASSADDRRRGWYRSGRGRSKSPERKRPPPFLRCSGKSCRTIFPYRRRHLPPGSEEASKKWWLQLPRDTAY